MFRKIKILFKIFRHDGFIEGLSAIKNFFIWKYYKYLRKNLLLENVQGSKMHVNYRDDGVSKALAIYGIREKMETSVLKKEISRGMTIVDIGANIGYYTLIEASIVSRNGKIYAFEPYPENFELLNKNVEVNGYSPFVEAYHMAVSNKNGIGKLFLGKANNLHTLLNPNMTDEYLEVKTITLDEFLKDKGEVDFIRMDIEGYECEAIDGMMETLKQKKPLKLFFEVHPPYPKGRSLKSRLEKLFAIGYKPKIVISAEFAQPKKFVELGYKPKNIIRDGKFYRGLYENIEPDDLVELVSHIPKITRTVLLEKRGD